MSTGLDLAILHSTNAMAGSFELLDQVVLHMMESPIVKGSVPMMILWGLWFLHPAGSPKREAARASLASTILVACVAIAVGRGLAHLLPFRPRPIHADGLGLNTASGFDVRWFDGLNSMPSDHAVLYFALATGILLVSRTLGLVAFAHAVFLISLPRVFVGVHYPSDILLGGMIGIAVAGLLHGPCTALVRRGGLLSVERTRPGWFYAAMFAVTFQIASMFDSLRALLRLMIAAVL